jgi:hypothetical protein
MVDQEAEIGGATLAPTPICGQKQSKWKCWQTIFYLVDIGNHPVLQFC